ncbi:MAG: hypothetical protein RL235_1017 [Chlamydiota bacterium]|jgi:methionyl-tRNA formyltransferase
MKPLRIVFFGTPQFAAEVLKDLISHQVIPVAVVTQPDRPKGRSLQVTESAVKQVAAAESVPLMQPDKASDARFLEELRALKGDLFVVVAYGQILSETLLSIPPLGCINVHASLLPKYRGAAPIQRCLMQGDTMTGIAIQKMVRALDAGDVIAEERLSIDAEETFGELEKRLCSLSQPLLRRVLMQFQHGIPSATAQDISQVTFAQKIEASDCAIDWCKNAGEIHNLVRALSPRPGAWTTVGKEGGRLKILRVKIVPGRGQPGVIIDRARAHVACGEHAIELIEVQPEGKKAMQGEAWLRGAPYCERLGSYTTST